MMFFYLLKKQKNDDIIIKARIKNIDTLTPLSDTVTLNLIK